jgi:hypothetical protein
VDRLHARFGPNAEEIPLDMCPCGNRKATLRRFLVARKYNIDEAEMMIRDTLSWRLTVTVGNVQGVDNILRAKPRWDLLSENRKMIPSTPFHCRSKQGFPVYLLRLGKGDGALATTTSEECHVYCSIIRGEHLTKVLIPAAQVLHTNRKDCSRQHLLSTKNNDNAKNASSKSGSDDDYILMDKQVVIVDLEGLGMSALRCLYVFKTINSVAAFNYPELSKAIYVVNSPPVFDYLWSVVKPLLAVHTQSKIRIFRSGARQYEALQNILEDDDIPDYLTPQVEGKAPRGLTGTVTDATNPDFRPRGVVELDDWILAQSRGEPLNST